MQEAAELATSTQILMNVSEFTDVNQATDALISSIQAFKYTAEESMDVVDILNTIGNNYAISTSDLAQSLTKSSGSLVAANGTLQEAVALTATANTIIQDSDVVGTALKTVAMRLRGTSVTEMEDEGLDTDGAITSKSKLQSQVQKLSGVNILTDDGAYKSTYQILKEISEVWEDINDMDQAALLELIAGKRSGSVMSAILQNPDILKDAFESANDASGSALKENETYLESIQGHIDIFTNSVQTMWQDTLSSDAMKWFVHLGTLLIKLITGFDVLGMKVSGLIPTIITLGAVIIKIVNKMTWGEFFASIGTSIAGWNTQLTGLATRLGLVNKSTTAATASQKALTAATLESSAASGTLSAADAARIATTNGLTMSQTSLTSAEALGILTTNGVSEAEALNIISKTALGQTTKKLTKEEFLNALVAAGVTDANKQAALSALLFGEANTKLGLSFKSLGHFFKTNSLLITLAAMAVSIYLIIKAAKSLITTLEESEEKLNDLNSALDATESKLNDLESQLKDTQDRIEELNNQPSLSFVEQEELDKLRAQNDELERTIDITKQIREGQQKAVNNQASQTAQQYGDINFKTGKSKGEYMETGATVGGIAGGIAGGVGGLIAGSSLTAALTAAGSVAPGVGNAIGFIVGTLITAASAALGAGIGSGVGAIVSDASESVDDAIDNMVEQRKKLQDDYNKAREAYAKDPTNKKIVKQYEKAEEALASYDSMMSEHMFNLDSYYSQIDLGAYDPILDKEKIDQLRKEMNDFYDKQDQWAIDRGGADAKNNALNRIFGENAIGGFVAARNQVDKLKENLKEAYATEDELAIEQALEDLENFKLEGILSYEEIERLRQMGIYLYEAEDYFKDVTKAESKFIKNDLEDVVKDINKIADGLGSLKSAFEEVIEEGVLTAKTITDLKEELKIDEKYANVEEVTDAWQEYLGVMMSGTASTEEMTLATEQLAQSIMEAALESENGLTPDNKFEYVAQLKVLGVENAEEVVNDFLQKNMVKEMESKLTPDKDVVRDHMQAQTGINISDEIVSSWTEEDLKAYGEQFGIISQISEDYKQEIMDRYGVEEDALDAIIGKLQEKQEIERQIDAQKKEIDDYNKWISKEGNYRQLKEALDHYDQNVTEQYEKLKSEVGNLTFNDGIFRDSVTGQVVTSAMDDNYEEIVDKYDRYQNFKSEIDEYFNAKERFDEIVKEGQSLGYVNADGTLNVDVPVNYQTNYNDLQDQLEATEDYIEKTLIPDVQLQIELQEKSKLVDDIQSAFDTLVDAQKEYDESGYISVDTLQSLLELEPKYLDLLVDEQGNLNITKTALYDVAKARITDMGIQSQKNILEKAYALASKGSSDALREQIEVMQNANDVGRDFVEVEMAKISAILDEKVAAGDLGRAEADAFIEGTMNQIKAVQVATQSTLDNLQNSLSSSSNTATAEVEDAFQKAMDYWENRIGANQSLYEQIQNDIDLLEKKGQIAGESYYQAQINVENERLQHLKEQREEATAYLKNLDTGSDKWWEVANTLNDIEGEIDDVTLSIQDLSDAMDQVRWTIFDEAHERIGDLTTQLSNVRDILSTDEDSFFNDEGEWTETGVAVLGTYIQEIELYKNALADVDKERQNLNINDFDSEQEYYDKLTELTEQQHEYTMAINESEQSIVDMFESSVDAIEEYTQTLIDGYNDYIDSVKEALDAERDLYDFKKNVQKQAKDIAEIERRIASLSGSTNKADIAERRKLEAQLYESRESLNDTYYDHAKQSQQDALDSEREAYEENMNRFVEGLRTSLEEATANMDEFLMGVASMVTLNADTILNKYESTELPLSTALTNPWEAAKKASNSYSGNALDLMNQWTEEDGFFAKFNTSGTTNLTSPWNAGKSAAEDFGLTIKDTMKSVYDSVNTNVVNSVAKLNELKAKYAEINDFNVRVSSDGGSGGGGGGVVTTPVPNQDMKLVQKILRQIYNQSNVTMSGIWDDASKAALANVQKMLGIPATGLYNTVTARKIRDNLESRRRTSLQSNEDPTPYRSALEILPLAFHAKGTLGTKRDEWAITDESWIGEEITLAAGKNGQLQYLKKGSAVMPADISANLVEWGKLDPSMLDIVNPAANINIINNAVNKPEFNFTFDALVKAERIDENTLPEVKKFVQQEINSLVKQMNYAIKGKGGR